MESILFDLWRGRVDVTDRHLHITHPAFSTPGCHHLMIYIVTMSTPSLKTRGQTFPQPLHNHSHDSLPSGSLPSLHPLMHEAKAAVEMQVRAS